MTSELDCFDHGMKYVGTVTTTLTGSYSASYCQQSCLGNWRNCYDFTYDALNSDCVHFTSITAKEISLTSISGDAVENDLRVAVVYGQL
jgi:hypothetical protein